MNVSHDNYFRLLVAGAFLFSSSFHTASAQTDPAQQAQEAPSEARVAQQGFDPMDSLLEFSVTPSDQLQPARETDALELLLNESSALRDPFWPVGYTPPAPKQDPGPIVEHAAPQIAVEPQWNDALRNVSVKGIMSVGGGRFMAVVNDQVVGENDTVTVTFGLRRYSWRIHSITAQGVKFEKLTSTQ